MLIAVIEDIPHQLRQLDDTLLGFLRVNIDQCVDIIQRVHEEVRINLVFQIFQLLVQILVLQLLEFLLTLILLEQQLDGDIHAKHKYENNDTDKVELVDDERTTMMTWWRTHLVRIIDAHSLLLLAYLFHSHLILVMMRT